MAKSKTRTLPVDTGRGVIKENYQHALVTSKVCRIRRVESKKTYQRKAKHRSNEGFAIAA